MKNEELGYFMVHLIILAVLIEETSRAMSSPQSISILLKALESI